MNPTATPIISPDTFMYNNTDMRIAFNLMILHYDVLSPPKRARKILIPEYSGAYDQGARWHDERELRMECNIYGDIGEKRLDDMKFLLSHRGRITLWDKTDRYYIGAVYDYPEITDHYMHCMRSFELRFICKPYAVGNEQVRIVSQEPVIPINNYIGTRETPTRLTIRNTGTTPLSNIRITVRKRDLEG